MRRFYTAESVTEGHQDKLCDRIADAVLDECLKEDSESRAVDHPQERRKEQSKESEARENGAGNQGVMIGYARNETEQLIPMSVVLAHRIMRELSACRRSEYIKGILPGGKAQVTVDSYGSMVPHGGGAFSGKDCSKVDWSGAYMARYIVKNLVAANLADRCQVSLASVIGMTEPVMVQVDTLGTGRVCADDCLAAVSVR